MENITVLFLCSVQAQFSQLRPPAIATPVAPRMPLYPPGAPGLGQQLFYGQGPPAILPPQVIAIFLSQFIFMFNYCFIFTSGGSSFLPISLYFLFHLVFLGLILVYYFNSLIYISCMLFIKWFPIIYHLLGLETVCVNYWSNFFMLHFCCLIYSNIASFII